MSDFTQRLRQHVEILAREPRPAPGDAHRRARQYVAEHLQEAGFDVHAQRHDFDDVPALNLLTTPLPGDDGLPLLIVGAHYDSVPLSPGADDNASAVAALLELARELRSQLETIERPRARLQLVAYDLEELGMLGSEAHARLLVEQKTNVLGMMSLEMLGYTDDAADSQRLPEPLVGLYPSVGNFIGVVGNERSAELVRTILFCMRATPGLPVEAMVVPADGHPLPATRLSDHSPFWDAGFPAVMITDTSFYRNPHYHQKTDTPDTLDYDFLTHVTQGIAAAILTLLRGD